jgi:hypothetical protein
MHNYYLLIALDTARSRAAEADRDRLASAARAATLAATSRVNPVRRAVARAAVAVARAADERALRLAPPAH